MEKQHNNTGCCVPLCNGKGGHSFPSFEKSPIRHNKWKVAIRRDKWKPNKWSKVCSRHFVSDDYVQETFHGKLFVLL
jgi:hypothetical protein